MGRGRKGTAGRGLAPGSCAEPPPCGTAAPLPQRAPPLAPIPGGRGAGRPRWTLRTRAAALLESDDAQILPLVLSFRVSRSVSTSLSHLPGMRLGRSGPRQECPGAARGGNAHPREARGAPGPRSPAEPPPTREPSGPAPQMWKHGGGGVCELPTPTRPASSLLYGAVGRGVGGPSVGA